MCGSYSPVYFNRVTRIDAMGRWLASVTNASLVSTCWPSLLKLLGKLVAESLSAQTQSSRLVPRACFSRASFALTKLSGHLVWRKSRGVLDMSLASSTFQTLYF